MRPPPISTLFPYTTLFRSWLVAPLNALGVVVAVLLVGRLDPQPERDSASSYSSGRSEEHTSELQSPDHLVCRLLLEKKNSRNTAAHAVVCPVRHRLRNCGR